MKTSYRFFTALILFLAIASCTPQSIMNDTDTDNVTFGTGGDDTSDPDDDKDGDD